MLEVAIEAQVQRLWVFKNSAQQEHYNRKENMSLSRLALVRSIKQGMRIHMVTSYPVIFLPKVYRRTERVSE